MLQTPVSSGHNSELITHITSHWPELSHMATHNFGWSYVQFYFYKEKGEMNIGAQKRQGGLILFGSNDSFLIEMTLECKQI